MIDFSYSQIDPSFTFLIYGNGMQRTTSGLELWAATSHADLAMNAGVWRLARNWKLTPYASISALYGAMKAQSVAVGDAARPRSIWHREPSLTRRLR